MNRDEIYSKILDISIKENKTDIYTHMIEEMSELMQEICKNARNKESFIFEEMADVYFQVCKLLKMYGLQQNFLIDLCIEKTKERFPEEWKIINVQN